MAHLWGPVRRRRAAVAVVVALIASVLMTPTVAAPVGAVPIGPPDTTQYPFACTVFQELGVQPMVDNQVGEGIPVIDETKVPDWRDHMYGNYPWRGDLSIIGPNQVPPTFAPVTDDELAGWSRDCNIAEPVVQYRYLTNAPANPATPWVLPGRWQTFSNTGEKPTDIAKVRPRDPNGFAEGEVDFIVRWERGVINRFIYSIAVLAPFGEQPGDVPANDLWNGRLIYHFGGGVGIGHTQGRVGASAALYTQELERGYGVVYSTGTATSHHYNLKLGGETAVATKARFARVYGTPTYTVGVGGSGGGIQQYVYGQNHPGLLDGGVPQYSYPDMVTQTIHIGDCELLEHYFEKTDAANRRWQTAENRIPVIGLNAESAPINKAGSATQWSFLYTIYKALGYSPPTTKTPGTSPPLTECRAAWTGLTPSAMNPTFQTIGGMNRVEGYNLADVEFTHWADAGENYGYDDDGWARVPWGNEGVQYGLRAVAEGRLTPAEFLRLNALVGSWKDTGEQVPEGVPFSYASTPGLNLITAVTGYLKTINDPDPVISGPARAEFDQWSSRNMNLSPDGVTPAPRRSADPIAVANAFASGQVFTGRNPVTDAAIDIPLIDWRHYLEEELDMHNSHQSFAARQRLIDGRGDYGNQLVWFTDGRPTKGYDQTPMALDVLDEWIGIMQASPGMSAANAKAALFDLNPLATDACFNTNGVLIEAGPDVWDGIIDDDAPGRCNEEFEIYTTSRIEAGAPINGDRFTCDLISVEQALDQGYYGSWRPTTAQLARLNEIFPSGVCGFGSFHAPDDPPLPPPVPFTDINPDGFYGAALRWATALGITTGVTDTTFNPLGNLNRAQVAAFLWRFAGEPRTLLPKRFGDVPAGSYFDVPTRWLTDRGLTTGANNNPNRYNPTGTVTRAQAVSFLWRLAGEPTPLRTVGNQFTDVNLGFFYAATQWAFENGITEGKGSPTRFAPTAPVTRAEMVTFLKRFTEWSDSECLSPVSAESVVAAVC